MLPRNFVVTNSDHSLITIEYFLIWCISSYCVLFFFTGYCFTIEVKHAPNRWCIFFEYLLWFLGVEASEL